jgi:DNA-binding NtrC family response regulator
MKKILVVGNDPKISEDLRKYFNPQEYTLLPSYDPKNVIMSLINLKPDLIILNLPDLKIQNSCHSGIEILEKLKETNSSLPVIAITDSSSNLIKMDLIKQKIHAFIRRPFQPEKLSDLVKEALSTGMSRITHTGGTMQREQKELKEVTKFLGQPQSSEKAKIDCAETLGKTSTGERNYYQMFDELLAPIFDKIMVNSKSNVYDHLISSLEKCLLSLTLKYCNHNQVKASQILGISRNTLRERIKRYDLW